MESNSEQAEVVEEERQLFQIKGTAWLLEDLPAEKDGGTGRERAGKLKYLNRKWKKNYNNRFDDYTRTIQKTIQDRFSREHATLNAFAFDSLRTTETSYLPCGPTRRGQSFHSLRRGAEEVLFGLQRKEKNLQLQVGRMEKLKEVTNIFQQKKLFYDSSVEQYFADEER